MLEPPVRIADPRRRQRIILIVAIILLVSAALRLYQIAEPAEYMFDEVYYAKDAKAILDGRVGTDGPLRWEAGEEVSWPHPEMGKFAIALGVRLFGDRAFGWRFPAFVAGMVMLGLVYPLARRLGLPPPWALIALGLAAADPLGIAQSRIATLDVFVGVWTVLCIYLGLRYVQDGRRRWTLVLSALAGGMALGTKWSGALALVVVAVLLVVVWLRDRRRAGEDARSFGRALPGCLFTAAVIVLLPLGVWLLSYAQYFASGHTWSDFVELQRQALYFNMHLTQKHTYASASYTWIFDFRPVWYYFQGGHTYRGVISMGNPLLWWLSAIGLVAAAVLAVSRRSLLLLPPAIIIALLYFPWFAASRTSFLYYMTPVAPFMAILVAGMFLLYAGKVELPRHGIVVMAVAGIATALLWDPVGRAAKWSMSVLPGGVDRDAGWIVVAVLIALIALVFLLAPQLQRRRPMVAMVLAGMTIGIVVAFIPIVLNIPISVGHFNHIMWFRNWI